MKRKDSILLIDNYLEWYKSKIEIKKLRKADEIITPYTNHINDRIPIYIIWHNDDTLELSDDGLTLNELDMMGMNYNTNTRLKILDGIIRKYSLRLVGNTITTGEFDIANFPQKKHDILQAILSVYDLLNLNESNTRNMFKEDVYNFFFENEFGGNVSPKFTGSSSINYSMDYSLGATKSRPNIMFQFVRNPNFDTITSQSFIYDDLINEEQFKAFGLKIVMVTDTKSISDRNLIAAETANVEIIPFANKDKLLSLK